MKKIDTIARWVGRIEICLILIAILAAISVHVFCWIDFLSFLIATGAILAFGIVSLLPSFIFAKLLLERLGWSDDEDVKTVMFEIGFVSLLAAPLWYCHASQPGHAEFWLWTMVPVCTLFPLAFSGAVAIASIKAARLDKEADEQAREAEEEENLKRADAWSPYVLDKSESDGFKEMVETMRIELNLVYAQARCVRLLYPKQVTWYIVDDHAIDCLKDSGEFRFEKSPLKDGDGFGLEESLWEMDVDKPMPSFAVLSTVVYHRGRTDNLHVKVTCRGEFALALGDKDVQPKDFATRQEMMTYLAAVLK